MRATGEAGAQIDVLVPIHTTARPLARLLDSVLGGTQATIRVLVICHDVPPEQVHASVAKDRTGDGVATDPRVVYLPYSDGVPSPAGPLAYALDRLEAPYFTKVDSDDTLEPGALDAWLDLAHRCGAGVVLPRMPGHGPVPTPPLRVSRWRAGSHLDPIADRLAYRTSTMGLIRSDLAPLARPELGLVTGEDIAPGLRLWFGGHPVVWAGRGPGYRVHHDGAARATQTSLALADRLGFVAPLVADPVLSALGTRERAAIAAKLLRVQVLGGLTGTRFTCSDREVLAAACRALTDFGDGAAALSRLDAALLAVASDPASDVTSDSAQLSGLAHRRARRSPSSLIPVRAGALRRADGAGRIDAAFALGMVGRAAHLR